MKTGKTSRTQLIVLAVLAVAFVLGMAAKFSLPHMHTLTGQASQARKEAAALNAESDSIEKATKDRAAFDTQIDQYMTALPPSAGVADVISALQTAAAHDAVSWVSGAPNKAPTTDAASGTQAWTVQMSISGTAQHLSAFLDDVRNLPRLIVVDSVSMQTQDATTDLATLSLRFFATGSPTPTAGSN